MSEETKVSPEMQQLASELQARIASLENLFEQPLKDEMASLKVALLENPSAAALLKDEDVGSLVKALRRTVSTAVAAASEAKTSTRKTKAPKVTYTQEQLAAMLDGDLEL